MTTAYKTTITPEELRAILEQNRPAENPMELRKREQLRLDRCFADFAAYSGALMPSADDDGAARCVAAYAESFDGRSPIGLWIYGRCGTGKTYLAAALCRALIESGKSAIMCDLTQTITRMEASWEKRAELMDELLAADLLVVDDIGTSRTTDYVAEWHDRIIGGRYNMGRPCVFTSNALPDSIGDAKQCPDGKWGRISQRITATCIPVELCGDNRRLAQARELFGN